ncbi:hypothetical protein [Reichenbachiella ulvae]|uniref:Lipoprotein n=1 Tax=Reichenbachiella ulvae TaxID=2980104 RepID=A0ABT3CR64_9BACT|nr:hypothetical protein [Reichenbachiella ulvae]MCV9385989.1 hypothetical protein [Reichenbachiella ulvae]
MKNNRVIIVILLLSILVSCKPYELYYVAETPEIIAKVDALLTNKRGKLALYSESNYIVFCKGQIDIGTGLTKNESNLSSRLEVNYKKDFTNETEVSPVVVKESGFTIMYVPKSETFLWFNTIDVLNMVPSGKTPILLEDNTGKFESIIMFQN